jgi:hypothetical protein
MIIFIFWDVKPRSPVNVNVSETSLYFHLTKQRYFPEDSTPLGRICLLVRPKLLGRFQSVMQLEIEEEIDNFGSEILAAMASTAFWDVTPCSLVEIYQVSNMHMYSSLSPPMVSPPYHGGRV